MLARIITTLALMLGAMAISAPAQAEEYDFPTDEWRTSCDYKWNGEPWQSMCWTQFPAADADHPARFVLVAPRYAWGIRHVARYVDRRVPGIRIHRKFGLTCDDVPERRSCIVVEPRNYGKTAWGGQVVGVGEPVQRVQLNTWHLPWYLRVYRQRAAGHELMHALGMDHHAGPGIVGAYSTWRNNEPRFPVQLEVDVLRAYYGQYL